MGSFCSRFQSGNSQIVAGNPDDSFGLSDSVWRRVLTKEEARESFEKDGSLPLNCCGDMLKLRIILGDPIMLRDLAKFAMNVDRIQVLQCWAQIMEYRSINSSMLEYQLSRAESILHFLLGGAGVASRETIQNSNILLDRQDEEAVNTLLVIIERIYGKVVKLHERLVLPAKQRSEKDSLDQKLFDEVLYICLECLLKHVYKPFKNSDECVASLKAMKSRYNQVEVDDFEYMEELGRGAFGCVVKCRKKTTGIMYAMKIQTKDGLFNMYSDHPERVMTERDALSNCHHPFIVNMDYALQTQELVLMAMELLTGGNLNKALMACPQHRMPEKRVKFYVAQVLLALAHLHTRKMIYRDLKPENILLGADGYVKLADLGGIIEMDHHTVNGFSGKSSPKEVSYMSGLFAKVPNFVLGNIARKRSNSLVSSSQHSSDKSSKVTSSFVGYSQLEKAYTICGTRGFMAPEMVVQRNSKQSDREGYTSAIDYWSLGVVLYLLLCGHLPFGEAFFPSVENYVYQGLPSDVSISEDCASLIAGLLVADARCRLGSGPKGHAEVRSHPFFRDTVQWRKLLAKEVDPTEYLDDVRGVLALQEMSTPVPFRQMLMNINKLGWVNRSLMEDEEQVHFANWNYVAPAALTAEMVRAGSGSRVVISNGSVSENKITSPSLILNSIVADSKIVPIESVEQ